VRPNCCGSGGNFELQLVRLQTIARAAAAKSSSRRGRNRETMEAVRDEQLRLYQQEAARRSSAIWTDLFLCGENTCGVAKVAGYVVTLCLARVARRFLTPSAKVRFA